MHAPSYELQLSKKRRTVQLVVKNGVVKVRAPSGISITWLDGWVSEKADWIKQQLATSPKKTHQNYLELNSILIAGQAVPFFWDCGQESHFGFDGNSVSLTLSSRIQPANLPKHAKKMISAYFTERAECFFKQKVAECSAQMALPSVRVVIGDWRSRWGYCRAQREVGFNWRLMQAPDSVCNYVVVHELAHLIHMNHSQDFWRLVKRYYPEYRQAKLWLKQHQALLFI